MKILIANPNTSGAMTAMMVDEARSHCRPDTEVDGIPADFGVPYIATRSEMAIAGYALLDTLARRQRGYDAVIVGAFCHAFVPATKELMPVPVIGIAEAAMRAAQILGRRIAIIGLGTPDRGANEDIVADLGMREQIASIRRLPLSGTQLTEDQTAADEMVIQQGMQAVEENHADVLVLGGAAITELEKLSDWIEERIPDVRARRYGPDEKNR